MQSPILKLTTNVSKTFKRNIGVFAPLLQKASDPIQQLFLDKIREYKSKSSGGKLVEPSPEVEKQLKNDRTRVFNQFGFKEGEDLSQIPAMNFKTPAYEHPGIKD